MDSEEALANKIREVVLSTPSHSEIGVRVGHHLKIAFPAFSPSSYHCKNLRDFIKRYVPDIAEVGRSGGDILYGAANKGTAEMLIVPPPSDGWNIPIYVRRAFARPRSDHQVFANSETGEVRTYPAGTVASSPWVHIPSCSPEEHLRIAREFIGTIKDESKRGELSKLLDEPRWWLSMYGVAEKLGVLADWSAFRTQALTELLIRRLAIIEKQVATAGLFPPKTLSSSEPPIVAIPSTSKPENSEDLLRETVLKIISALPLSELRLLKLPVGELFDAFTGK